MWGAGVGMYMEIGWDSVWSVVWQSVANHQGERGNRLVLINTNFLPLMAFTSTNDY